MELRMYFCAQMQRCVDVYRKQSEFVSIDVYKRIVCLLFVKLFVLDVRYCRFYVTTKAVTYN